MVEYYQYILLFVTIEGDLTDWETPELDYNVLVGTDLHLLGVILIMDNWETPELDNNMVLLDVIKLRRVWWHMGIVPALVLSWSELDFSI